MKSYSILVGILFLSIIGAESPYRPKTTSGGYCQIPFIYSGKSYQDCTMEGSSQPWCYTSSSNWEYCEVAPNFGTCEVAPATANSSEVDLIVSLLNNMRSRESALRMAKLKWNTELAMRAQFMSNLCEMGNSNTKLCTGDGNMGQISYMSMSSEPLDAQWMQFLLEFYSRKPAYNLDKNECSVKYCNGYKQIVNAATTSVGCARSTCKKDGMYADVYFCNFYPPIYSGRPYEQGTTTCDNCFKLDITRSFRCDNNLCDVCDSPSAECQGKDVMIQQIASGSICDDVNPSFCSTNAHICQYLPVLPEKSKTMMMTQCKKTCKLC